MKDLYVIKLGGNAIGDPEGMARLSREIAGLVGAGKDAVIVHGGGPQISEEVERRGMTPRKVCGVRVTDRESLAVAEDVLKALNDEFVGCLKDSGIDAEGIPGSRCTVCTKKPPMKAVEDGKQVEVDMGLVGEVSETVSERLYAMLEKGVTPVVYPIGADSEGNKLNVNADTMAAAIAAGVGCREMIAITDVPGILRDINDPQSKIDTLTLAEVDALIEDGTISGGMIPKVDACKKALLAGAATVRMVNGKGPEGILADVTNGIPHGTVITR